MSETVERRAMLIDAAGVEIITLNPVGTIVWSLLDQPRTAGEISGSLAARFPDHDPREIDRDVDEFLVEMRTARLVDVAG